MTSSGDTVTIGFGANYNHNMGNALKRRFSNSASDKGEEADSQHVTYYQLQNHPWGSDELISIETSSASTFFLTSSGKVYSCGMMHGNVLPSPTQLIIQLPLKCVEIAAGRHFALARMEGGLAVCSWGAGHFGQLALGDDSSPFIDHPTVIEALLPHVVGAPIAKISAGYWHAMAITEAGSLFTWGCNRSAQCGFKPSRDPPTINTPRKVRLESSPIITKAAGGRAHTVVLDDQGKAYAFGSSSQGQCAIYTRRRGVTAPKLIESLNEVKVVDVAAGDSHTLALTSGGRLFSFGSGHEGQLGTGTINQMNPKPKLVGDLDFVAIQAGNEWKAQQKANSSLNTTDTSADWQRIPTNKTDEGSIDSEEHTDLSHIPTITSITATGNSSFALSSSGHLYTWGCNDVSNLGHCTPNVEHIPVVEPAIPPARTSTMRQLHTRSFDSSHNIALPQRVDHLKHVRISVVAASPTFTWCVGKERSTHEQTQIEVGRTLYELQEMKRQKSLQLHRQSITKQENTTVDVARPTLETDVKGEDEQSNVPLDPPEFKDGSCIGEKLLVSLPLGPSISLDSAESLPPKSPISATREKRRFKIPKAIGKIVRRASKGSEGSATRVKK